ncbi:MAG TPA: MmcQ/YjbR family DNA-binding protein [Chitinophagales bacterium]|nr:MmcQ/YjbR family DNA-binding protein [Chitinophagales bacterium]
MNHIDEISEFCLKMPGVSFDFPFGEDTMVFRVMDKIFLLTSLQDVPLSFNAKADPEQAIEWREQHDAIVPGYHMNKKHWNTVTLDGSLSNPFVQEIIRHSYDCVVKGLSKKLQVELGDM